MVVAEEQISACEATRFRRWDCGRMTKVAAHAAQCVVRRWALKENSRQPSQVS